MKKLALVILGLTLFSCTPEENLENKIIKDCNCNRVVEVSSFNVIGSGTNAGSTIYRYTTINDCTGVQRESGLSNQSVRVGECK